MGTAVSDGRSVIEAIEQHLVFRHPFWKAFRSATETMDYETCVAIFHQFDEVTRASREPGKLPMMLNRNGLGAQAELVAEVLKSEEGHRQMLLQMMNFVLDQGFRKRHARAFESSPRKVTKAYFQRRAIGRGGPLLPASQRMIALFEHRMSAHRKAALLSLGVMSAVEFFAHRSYIPGCVSVLVGNPRFGKRPIGIPEFQYLAHHEGEAGAEADHERKMAQALVSGDFNSQALALVTEGAQTFCAAALEWYEEMTALLR